MGMEQMRSVPVSGSSVIMKECPKCGRRNARGVYMVRVQDGRHIFKCDICGQKRSMGWNEAQSLLMLEAKQGNENAVANRDRFQREFTEKYNQDYMRAVENLEVRPDAIDNFYDMLAGPRLSNDEFQE